MGRTQPRFPSRRLIILVPQVSESGHVMEGSRISSTLQESSGFPE